MPIFGAVLQKIVEFKDFSRLLSDFPVLFKADLIFKDFSKKHAKLKYFSSLCEHCYNFGPSAVKRGTKKFLYSPKETLANPV